MNRIVVVLLVMLTAGVPGEAVVQAKSQDEALTSLVEAERSFARTSIDKGMKKAFLTYLAGDSVVFRPRATAGRPVYEKYLPDSQTQLFWKPVFAEVSSAGDLGYTTGPYEVRRSRDEVEPSDFGHYVSVWRRGPSKKWNVLLDIGVNHPRPDPVGDEVKSSPVKKKILPSGTPEEQKQRSDELAEEDRLLAERCSAVGVATAYSEKAAEDFRLYRRGMIPLVGKDRVMDFLEKKASGMSWEPAAVGVSLSGDLGYTYGAGNFLEAHGSSDAAGNGFSYVRVWRRGEDGRWRLALEVVLEF